MDLHNKSMGWFLHDRDLRHELKHKKIQNSDYSEVHLEPCQTSRMEPFLKIVNAVKVFEKSSILDVWQGSEYSSVIFILIKW